MRDPHKKCKNVYSPVHIIIRIVYFITYFYKSDISKYFGIISADIRQLLVQINIFISRS